LDHGVIITEMPQRPSMSFVIARTWWRCGVAVTSYQQSYSTSGPVSTGTGDRLRRANHLSISPSHVGQLSLLPSAGREMSTGQSAVMLCSRGVKAGMVHSTCG